MTLFPLMDPFATSRVVVGGDHILYVEQSGNPHGIPIVFIHGGPGEHCDPDDRQLYDPAIWRVIMFDQRGCGQSSMKDSLKDNTLAYLVADLEIIRQYLEIDCWVVHGGSWGSTVGLAYAQHYPDRCLALLLNSLYLYTEAEHAYIFGGGYRDLFPELWLELLSVIPSVYHKDIRPYLYTSCLHTEMPNRDLLYLLVRWLGAGSKYLIDTVWEPEITDEVVASMRIYLHFIEQASSCPIDLLATSAIAKVHNIPTLMIHGRYDLCCPYALSTYKLSQLWPEATVVLVEGVGHRTSESLIQQKVLEGLQYFAQRLTRGNQSLF